MSDHVVDTEYDDDGPLDDPIPETPEERQLRSLDSFFSELNSGVRLLIQRIEPSWCRGVLEEIEIGNDPLDVDYFIDTWGGKLLSVKIRRKNGTLGGVHPIPLYSYPPLVRGERIYERERNSRPTEKDTEKPSSPSVVVNPSNGIDKLIQALPALLPMATSWFQAAEARRQSDRDLMMQMIARSQRSSGLSDITQLGSVMSQLSEVFKSNFTQSDPNDFSAFLPQALDILQKVLVHEPKSQKSHRITSTKPVPEPEMRPITSITTTKQDDLARSLAALPPEAGAAKLIEALGMMSPDKRDQVWSTFLSQYEETMEPEDDDINTDDENDFRGAK
jgi:hypothetical protein